MMPETFVGEHVLIRLVETTSEVKYFDGREMTDRNPLSPDDGDFYLELRKAADTNHGTVSRDQTIKDDSLPRKSESWNGRYGGPLGSTAIESISLVSNTIEIVFQGAYGAIFLKYMRDLLLQWLENRGGRSMTIEVDSMKITVTGAVDVDRALTVLRKMQTDYSSAVDGDPNRAKVGQRRKDIRASPDTPPNGRREPFIPQNE